MRLESRFGEDLSELRARLSGSQHLVGKNGYLGVKVANAHCVGLDLSGLVLLDADLEDVTFQGCDLTGCAFDGVFRGTTFSHCLMLGSELSLVRPSRIRLSECDLRMGLVRARDGEAEHVAVEITACVVDEASRIDLVLAAPDAFRYAGSQDTNSTVASARVQVLILANTLRCLQVLVESGSNGISPEIARVFRSGFGEEIRTALRILGEER